MKKKLVMFLTVVMVMLATVATPALAYWNTSYCGYSKDVGHRHPATWPWYKFHQTYYGGTNSNGYEWNDYWTYWQSSDSWTYNSWDWRYC